MLPCPHCGEENPEHARFCLRCGRPLDVAPLAHEERKIVTVLFCELVGDERLATADPEDLKRLLEPFHSDVRQEVSSYGGTVDKFMGATALAVFGAPVAHEDDPERALRVGLRLLESSDDIARVTERASLNLRMGVNTGEAVVARPGSGPQIGEAVTGDVVNTASRILALAAPGEILAGEETYAATRFAIRFDELEPVRVKGKTEPLAVWRVVESRTRMGVDVRPRPSTPFIGRREERTLIEGAFRRSIAESSVQLVTVTGEPGVGKTRLIEELSTFVQEYPDLIRWRQGRCLPYGEGVSFWALGEIVKAQAGILESDGPDEAGEKLAASLLPLVDRAPDRDWLRARLAPLAGVEGAAFDVPREELFTAWRRYVEALAENLPTVLVFEDLQWADDAFLAFVEHLVDWTVGLPLLVVCSARPELYERHPGWGGGRRNSASILLPPLSPPETAMLVSALLDRAVLPAGTQLALLERCGGNPLYAEEFVRMLRDRGYLEPGATRLSLPAGDEVAVPPTVQLLIGARLDTLAPEHKAVLQDAAVVGKVFWAGVVASMGGLESGVAEVVLHELSRREFVRPSRVSSVRGEAEYAFLHVVVQDVAYGQIPRASRGAKHLAVAGWIRGVAGERISDMAELLAHHHGLALELAESAGTATGELRLSAGGAFMMAGDRAKRLDASRAEGFYRRARAILPPEDPERIRALVEAAEAAGAVGRYADSERDLELAMQEYREAGDVLGLGEAMARLARSVTRHGRSARELLEEAIRLLETQPRGPELVRAYSRMAGHLYVAGDSEAGITWAEKALSLADELGMEDETVLALQYRGACRSQAGDPGGLGDLREALRIGLEAGLGEETAIAYNNLALQLWGWEGPEAAEAVWTDMTEFCRVRGFATLGMYAAGGALDSLFDLGDWDRALDTAAETIAWDQAHGGMRVGITALTISTWVHLRRGELEPVRGAARELLDRGREIGYPEFLGGPLMIGAELAALDGDTARLLDLVREFVAITDDQLDVRRSFLPVVARLLVGAGHVDQATALVEGAGEPTSKRQELSVISARAIVREAKGDLEVAVELYGEAEARWAEYRFPLERALTLLGGGRCLLALGRTVEALEALNEARAELEPLGARPFLEQIDEQMARSA